MKDSRRFLYVGLLFAASAGASCPAGYTSISDTLTNPGNTGSTLLWSGQVTIAAPSVPTSTNSTTFTRAPLKVKVANGVFTACLPPNDALSPDRTSYSVSFLGDGGDRWQETWVVPTAATNQTIRPIRGSIQASPNALVALSQLSGVGANTGNAVVWDGSKYSPTAVYQTAYATAPFTGRSTVFIPAITHGFSSAALLVGCYDASGVELECGKQVDPSVYDVTVTFASPQDGFIVVSGISTTGQRNFSKTFASATSVTATSTEDQFGSANLLVACYDTLGNEFDCSKSVDPTTHTVTVNFPTATSGSIVVSGR